jgi:hypothetical protein
MTKSPVSIGTFNVASAGAPSLFGDRRAPLFGEVGLALFPRKASTTVAIELKRWRGASAIPRNRSLRMDEGVECLRGRETR